MNTFEEYTHYQINEEEGENLPGTIFTEVFDEAFKTLFLKSCQVQSLASQCSHLCYLNCSIIRFSMTCIFTLLSCCNPNTKTLRLKRKAQTDLIYDKGTDTNNQW